MKTRRTLALLLFFCALFLAPGLPAGGKSKKPQPKTPFLKSSPREKSVTVRQEADQLEYDDKSKVMRLHGHVKLIQTETVLDADDATYFLNSEEAEATGNLKLTRPDGILTGNHLHLYYREKRAIFDGHVTLVRFLNQTKNLKENEIIDKTPVKIYADQLEYRWEEKIAFGTGNVVLVQGERKASADSGVYNELPDRLEMEGHVLLIRPPKDELECDHLVYFLKSNQAKALGHVRGKFVVKEDAKKAVPAPASSSPAPAPATPTKP